MSNGFSDIAPRKKGSLMPDCKHEEISRILAGEIAQKNYTDRFPTVRDLSLRFQVSTRTMTKALKPLIRQGLIIPDGPRGCRVAPQDQQRPRSGIVGIFAGIGKIVPMEDPLIGPLLNLVKRDNCTPLLTDVPQTEMIRDPNFWRSSYLDGYIFVYSSFNQQLANFLKSEGIAFAAANRLPDNYGAPWADFDHFQAFCKLYNHLRKSGSKRIALLDKPSFSNSSAYSSELWQRVQEHWQVPLQERCGTFGIPVEGENYRTTLARQLNELCKNNSMPDTVIARNTFAADNLKAVIADKALPIQVIQTSDITNSKPPYEKLAEAVWDLFKRVRNNTASFSEYCEIPYNITIRNS